MIGFLSVEKNKRDKERKMFTYYKSLIFPLKCRMCYQKINKNFLFVNACAIVKSSTKKKNSNCHDVVCRKGMRSPFFDLLHRLLSFVTQFKYISLSTTPRPRGRERERETNKETDRYKTNYTNLVKRIALALY